MYTSKVHANYTLTIGCIIVIIIGIIYIPTYRTSKDFAKILRRFSLKKSLVIVLAQAFQYENML